MTEQSFTEQSFTEQSFFATAPKGIETLLAEELRDLGLKDVKETRAGAYFTGTIADAYKVCLWTRLANRVLLPIAKFDVEDTDVLYDQIKQINWSDHMAVDQTLAVDASVSNSNITHSQYAALKTKDAIADYFRDLCDERPSVETDKPDLQINIYINNNVAQLSIDLSGESLHIRGYRTRGSVAPLKENLAAAILYRAKWPKIAKEGGDFVDLMCGSGTLPIEAAYIACDIAPGILRRYFGFLNWKQHQAEAWDALVTDAHERKQKGMQSSTKIFGFDHHGRTLEKTEQHVRQAGLEDMITIKCQDIETFDDHFSDKGLVALNPPYGNRLGDSEELRPLYAAIGNVLKTNFLGWKAVIFTDDKDKGKMIGVRANKIHSLFNGALPCKLLHFDIKEEELFKDFRLPRLVPDDELTEQSQGFKNRLAKNCKQMSRWANQEGITCYRVYDADLPDYSVAIDLYESVDAKIWINIQEYEAPKTIDPAKAKWRLREIVTIVKAQFNVDERQLFLKRRRRQKGNDQYEKMSSENNFHQVAEGDCRFWVNFEDYLDTGLFLDHRPIRNTIRHQSEGKAVLNLFAYTGAITVHAAKGAASSTLTLDMSKTYIAWAKRNMTLNGFESSNHEFLQLDCLKWLERPTTDKKFDIIFLDPPSFSNSKRMDEIFDVQKDHVSIITGAMKLLSADGVLYFSNNRRGFKMDTPSLGQYQIINITDESVPRDFKQRVHIHKCWKISAN